MDRRRRWSWVAITLLTVTVIALVAILFSDDRLRDLAKSEVYLLAIPTTLVPIAYTIFFQWWRSPMGRALFIFKFGMMLLVDFAVAVDHWGPAVLEPNFDEITFVVYTTILFGITYQLVVMSKIWWENRRATPRGRYAAYATPDAGDTPEAQAERQRRIENPL